MSYKEVESLASKLKAKIRQELPSPRKKTLEEAFSEHLEVPIKEGEETPPKTLRDLELELQDIISGKNDDFDQWI